MTSPRRLVKAWWKQRRMRDIVADSEWQLGIALKHSVRLVAARTNGYDCIYRAHSRRWPESVIACVRLNCPWRDARPDEPHLPRLPLAGPHRIAREASVYRCLAADGLTPRLLVQSETYLANEWLPWPRLADLLRKDDECIWHALPAVLRAIRSAHHLGEVHMDLNCGNVLLDPATGAVRLIDFEYAPVSQLNAAQLQAFDFLRLMHNLLKPRRGRRQILNSTARFAEMIDPWIPPSALPLLREFGTSWFDRITSVPQFRYSGTGSATAV
jgi:serine/threonine protein kinase